MLVSEESTFIVVDVDVLSNEQELTEMISNNPNKICFIIVIIFSLNK